MCVLVKSTELAALESVVVVINSNAPPPLIWEKSILFSVPASDIKNSSVSSGVAAKAVLPEI